MGDGKHYNTCENPVKLNEVNGRTDVIAQLISSSETRTRQGAILGCVCQVWINQCRCDTSVFFLGRARKGAAQATARQPAPVNNNEL